MTERTRELSFEERSRWGVCPACKAEDGKPCNPDVGIPLGASADGLPPREGAHLGRLQRAPLRIREIPA